MPFGGTIKLTGESEYRRAIQNITQDLSKMSSALKTQTADFSSNDKSIKNTAQASKELNESLKSQSEALAKAKTSYAQYSVAVQAQTTRHNALSKEYRNAVLELDKIKASSGETSDAYKKQAQVVDKLGQELAESTEELDKSKSAMSALKSEINNSQKTINATEKAIDDLGNETKDAGDKAKESEKGWSSWGQTLADLRTKAIGQMLQGLKQLGGAFIDVGKQAIDSYGEFEQLEGGVKKIFGDDTAQSVIDNANKAFSTAGMSANQYMETVTGFSSALIQSLDGDTAKSAEVADRAIRDMADNANTFGTSMESIQYAYQGFAKQNYTMLDNLKLGYGGTKEEMQRLIADASKMTDVQKELGITVDESDMSFANIANAISVVQKNMGIMGTTAKEASGTIQGSTGSMKSAWQNMLRGMADENANFEELAKNFVGTLITEDGQGGVLGTIIPRVSQVITGMSSAIQTMLPQLIQSVVPLIQQNLPIIMSAISDALQTILSVLPQVIPIIADLIPQIVSTLVGLLPDIINAGVQILLGLIQGISSAIPDLIKMLPDVIDSIVTTLIDNLPLIIDTGLELLVALTDGILNAIPQMVARLPEIIQKLIKTLMDNLPKIIDAGVKLLVALVQNMPAIINGIVRALPTLISGLISGLMQNLPAIISAGVQLLVALVQNMPAILTGILKAIPQIIKGIVQGIVKGVPELAKAGLDLIKGLWQGIKDAKDWIMDKIKGFMDGIVGGIKKFFGINSPSKLFRDEIGENLALGIGEGFSDEMKTVSQQMGDAIPKSFDIETSINSVAGARTSAAPYENMVGAFKEALSQMKIELDDDEVGRFIDKTVTRLIYT